MTKRNAICLVPAIMNELTEPQRKLLTQLKKQGGATHVFGPEVRIARRLEERGLVTLRDDGPMGPGGNWDRERWWCELAEAYREES